MSEGVMQTYFCAYMPDGHCMWETLHFDRRETMRLAPFEYEALFADKLSWRQMYRRGYRIERVIIRKVKPWLNR